MVSSLASSMVGLESAPQDAASGCHESVTGETVAHAEQEATSSVKLLPYEPGDASDNQREPTPAIERQGSQRLGPFLLQRRALFR